eukprot:IDg17483t1
MRTAHPNHEELLSSEKEVTQVRLERVSPQPSLEQISSVPSSTAAIIHIPVLESAIVKKQLGKYSDLTGEERASVSMLELPGQI